MSAIFVHDSIQHFPQFLIIYRDKIDVVGTIITLDNGNHLVIKSLYNPCGSKDIQSILEAELSGNNTFIFGGMPIVLSGNNQLVATKQEEE